MRSFQDLMERFLSIVIEESGLANTEWREMLGPAREVEQGDIALPCFPFSKILECSPIEIAENLAERLNKLRQEVPELSLALENIQANNGYLNLRTSIGWLIENAISKNLENLESVGSYGSTGHRVLIEHTSANPNGPFHVGRARNAILGDTLVRLNRLFGHQVRAEYYLDDMGKQVGILAWSLEKLDEEQVSSLILSNGRDDSAAMDSDWSNKSDHRYVRWYQAANILKENQESVDAEVGELVRRSEEGDQEVLDTFEAAYQPILDGMLETLDKLGIGYDTFTRESMFVINGSVNDVMQRLKKSPLHGIAENGAHYLELETKGVKGKNTKFFFQRGDGSSLYATRDIAYHLWKWTQCDTLINVLGEDHKLQSKQVAVALDEIGSKTPEVIFYAFIKLPDGKMSTRRGNVVYMDDLIEEGIQRALSIVKDIRGEKLPEGKMVEIAESVAISAIRFNIARIAPDKGFTFKWEDALSFDSDSAPFIMYSHTRACSIRTRLSGLGEDIGALLSEFDVTEIDLNNQPESLKRLLRRVLLQGDALSSAVEQCRPHIFANHLLALANDYNAFYRDCPVISKQGVIDKLNLATSEITRHLLSAGCNGLGIIALEQM